MRCCTARATGIKKKKRQQPDDAAAHPTDAEKHEPSHTPTVPADVEAIRQRQLSERKLQLGGELQDVFGGLAAELNSIQRELHGLQEECTQRAAVRQQEAASFMVSSVPSVMAVTPPPEASAGSVPSSSTLVPKGLEWLRGAHMMLQAETIMTAFRAGVRQKSTWTKAPSTTGAPAASVAAAGMKDDTNNAEPSTDSGTYQRPNANSSSVAKEVRIAAQTTPAAVQHVGTDQEKMPPNQRQHNWALTPIAFPDHGKDLYMPPAAQVAFDRHRNNTNQVATQRQDDGAMPPDNSATSQVDADFDPADVAEIDVAISSSSKVDTVPTQDDQHRKHQEDGKTYLEQSSNCASSSTHHSDDDDLDEMSRLWDAMRMDDDLTNVTAQAKQSQRDSGREIVQILLGNRDGTKPSQLESTVEQVDKTDNVGACGVDPYEAPPLAMDRDVKQSDLLANQSMDMPGELEWMYSARAEWQAKLDTSGSSEFQMVSDREAQRESKLYVPSTSDTDKGPKTTFERSAVESKSLSALSNFSFSNASSDEDAEDARKGVTARTTNLDFNLDSSEDGG